MLPNIVGAQCQPPIAALVLILRVKADVGEPVRYPECPGRSQCEARVDPRTNIGNHAVGAKHEGMGTPMRLERYPPIWRHTVEQPGPPERVHADRILLVESERPVAGRLEI